MEGLKDGGFERAQIDAESPRAGIIPDSLLLIVPDEGLGVRDGLGLYDGRSR